MFCFDLYLIRAQVCGMLPLAAMQAPPAPAHAHSDTADLRPMTRDGRRLECGGREGGGFTLLDVTRHLAALALLFSPTACCRARGGRGGGGDGGGRGTGGGGGGRALEAGRRDMPEVLGRGRRGVEVWEVEVS